MRWRRIAAWSGMLVSLGTGAQTVSFVARHASPLDMIAAITKQSCAPIGIVAGRDIEALAKKRSFDVRDVPFVNALDAAVIDTGFRVVQEDDVYVLIARDATNQQLELMHHRLAEFGGGRAEVMQMLQVSLSASMGSVVEPSVGYGGSIPSSPDDAFEPANFA